MKEKEQILLPFENRLDQFKENAKQNALKITEKDNEIQQLQKELNDERSHAKQYKII